MKISEKTIAALDVLRHINPSIVVTPGKTLVSVSPTGKVSAIFHVDEEFPKPFALYDLTRFLLSLKLMPDADVEFGERSLTICSGTGTVTLWYSVERQMRGAPNEEKIAKAPSITTFRLSAPVLEHLQKMFVVLAVDHIRVWGDGTSIFMGAVSANIQASDNYKSMPIAESTEVFSLSFAADLFKMLRRIDHDVRVLKSNGHIVMTTSDYIMLFAAERKE